MIPVAGLVLAGIALTMEPEDPDINDAKGFLRYYYATAPAVPGDTWAHLTPAYQAEGPSYDDQQFNFPGVQRPLRWVRSDRRRQRRGLTRS